jgi:hypothetical protein
MKTYSFKMVGVVLACAGFLMCLAAHAAGTDTNSVAATNAAPGLATVKAVYGDLSDPSSTSDVTEQVEAMIKNDMLSVDATDDNFGDPASGVTKQLRVNFTFDGVPGSKSVYEHGKLRISVADKPNPQKTGASKLVIRNAVYGVLPDGATIDVTSIVTGMVQTNSLTLTVNNDDFGDPAPYEAKELRVEYTLSGTNGSQTAAEGKTVKISADSN